MRKAATSQKKPVAITALNPFDRVESGHESVKATPTTGGAVKKQNQTNQGMAISR